MNIISYLLRDQEHNSTMHRTFKRPRNKIDNVAKMEIVILVFSLAIIVAVTIYNRIA